MVKTSSNQFILYLLFFFAGFLLVIPKKHFSLPVALQENSPSTANSLPRTFLLNPQTLATNKVRIQAKDPTVMPAYNNLINQANKLLTQKSISVTDKSQTPPSGTKHDYMSLATYYWPNPNTKNGLPYVSQDGKTNPEINTIPDDTNLHSMISSVNTLSLAYYFSGNKNYADHAALLVKTWFIEPKTKMNPNLNYAQIIKGKNNKGMAGGIIDTANMPQVIDALGILDSAGVLSPTDKSSLRSWFAAYLNWLRTSDSGKYIAQAKSNQRTWYDGQLISISLFLNQNDLARQIAVTDMQQLIPEEIDPNGTQPNELSRTKSWDYSTFNLAALCNLADLSQEVNLDLWHYQTKDGRSIKKAIDFLTPYAVTQKKWPYTQLSTMNIRGIISPLREASTAINSSYWNESVKIEGKNSSSSIDILKYKIE